MVSMWLALGSDRDAPFLALRKVYHSHAFAAITKILQLEEHGEETILASQNTKKPAS